MIQGIYATNETAANITYFPQLCTKNYTVLSIEQNKCQTILVNVYIPPKEDVRHVLPVLQDILDRMQGKNIIIAGDFNIRSTLWHDVRNYAKLPFLEEILTQNNLHVLNQSSNQPTFETINWKSNIDITLANQEAAHGIVQWKVTNTVTMSDHNPIEFQYKVRAGQNDGRIEQKYTYDTGIIKTADIQITLENLNENVGTDYNNLNTEKEIDNAIDFLLDQIDTLIKKHGKKRKKFVNRPDWWNSNIERKRQVYHKKKNLLYKNKIPQRRDYLYAEMKQVKNAITVEQNKH